MFSVLVAFTAIAQDVVTVGTVTASGTSVDVPVYIRDRSGTSLGIDQPAGSKIQSFSIKVSYAPAAAVQSVTFSRAGITANLTPTSEFTPSGAGSISLLDTFVEATNPIPFTLNAGVPGDQVAHLVFTLSNAATPGSTIALTLDPSLTQLTDAGGTAATKETAGNGRLDLVDGQIDVPALAVTLSPSARNVFVDGSTELTATLNSNAPADTTIALSSSSSGVASVPVSVLIRAGRKSAPFNVNALAAGTATITATLGGSTSSANINVSEAPVQCAKPAAPQLRAPESARVGVPYEVTWDALAGASEYVIEEADNLAFTNALMQTLATTSKSFTHTNGSRFYYRIRARNHTGACDLFSSFSPAISVLITEEPVPETRVLVVAGSLAGNAGSFFRTSLQLHNPGSAAVSGKLVFHPAGVSASPNDPSLPYSIAPGKTLSFADLLPAMGVSGGIGSVDLVGDPTSPLPLAIARVFNDGGAAGTTGLTEEAMLPADALTASTSAVLFAPDDAQRFRLNIGIRTLTEGATMTITVRDRDGLVVKTVTRTDPPSFFTQISSAVLLDGHALVGGETLTFEVSGGSAFLYGATTDNTTNDPSVQFGRSL
jgi:uncharacterized protein YjdB